MITFSRDVILKFVLNRGGVGIYCTVTFSRDVFLNFVFKRGGVGFMARLPSLEMSSFILS
jgi:hypothetical protein